jgi:Lhr-like helicase
LPAGAGSDDVEDEPEVARFLGGAAPVEIVAPPASKTFELGVVVPMDDMTNPPPPPGAPKGAADGGDAEYTEVTGSVWPHVEEAIVDRILENKSTIVFSNSRRLAERLDLHRRRPRADDPAGGRACLAQPHSHPPLPPGG